MNKIEKNFVGKHTDKLYFSENLEKFHLNIDRNFQFRELESASTRPTGSKFIPK